MSTSTMNGSDDRPVTRGELRAELERFATRADLRAELERFATRADLAELEARLEAFATKADLDERLEAFAAMFMRATQQQLDAAATASRQHIDVVAERLSGEIARASLAGGEQTRREIGALDDRYRDLPGRVALLERELDEHRRDPRVHRATRTPRRRS